MLDGGTYSPDGIFQNRVSVNTARRAEHAKAVARFAQLVEEQERPALPLEPGPNVAGKGADVVSETEAVGRADGSGPGAAVTDALQLDFGGSGQGPGAAVEVEGVARFSHG